MKTPRTTRRRTRRPDPLASRVAVRRLLAQLQAAFGTTKVKTEKELIQLLRATGYAERHAAPRLGRGRKSRWSEYDKSRIRQLLTDLLARENHRIGLRSFLEHYLLILEFPADVAEALESGQINLFEAEQLARLTARRLSLTEAQSRQRRQTLLRGHLQTAASGIRLKAKVDAVLHLVKYPAAAQSATYSAEILQATAELEAQLGQSPALSADWSEGLPPEHLFGEYLQLIGSLLRELRPADLADAEIERIADLAEPLIQYLHTLYKRQNPPLTEETLHEVTNIFSL